MTDEPRSDAQPSVERNDATIERGKSSVEPTPALPDPNDEIPVPIVMSPAEVDERAQVVEALREEEGVEIPPEQRDQEG